MRNEIKAIIFIAIVSFLAFLPGLPVLATALDDMYATTTGNNVVNIADSFYITGTSTLVQHSSWTGKRDCTSSYGSYPNFKYNLAGTLTSQGYTGINPASTCDGVKYLFSSAAITDIIHKATLSEGYLIATDFSGYPSHQPPDQAGFIILKWESGQLTIPSEYNANALPFPDDFFTEPNRNYAWYINPDTAAISVEQSVIDLMCPTHDSVFRCGVRKGSGFTGGWSASRECGWLLDRTSKFKADCLSMLGPDGDYEPADDEYYYYVAEGTISEGMDFDWHKFWHCNDSFYPINICDEDIDWEEILSKDPLYPDIGFRTSYFSNVNYFNVQHNGSAITDFSIRAEGIWSTYYDPLLEWSRLNVWNATGTQIVTNSTTSLDFIVTGEDQPHLLFRVDRFLDGPYDPQIFKFEYELCYSTSTCMEKQTFHVALTEKNLGLIPSKTYEEALAEEGGILATFLEPFGIDKLIRTQMARMKERFPFSWLWHTYDIIKYEVMEYSGQSGTSTAAGFTIGWKMPPSSAILAGQDFTVIDFEEAYDMWGNYFSMFRTIFIFVIYISLIMTVFYRTTRFLKELGEED